MSSSVKTTALDQARVRVQRIRSGLEAVQSVREDIAAAYQAQDWQALGYDSWESYVDSEFVGARLRLPREERRELVGSLRQAGMSTRAIAATTGTSKSQVNRDVDVEQTGVPNGAPEPEAPVMGLDGKSYAASKPPVTDLIDAGDIAELNGDGRSEPIEAEVVDDQPAPDGEPAVTPEPAPKSKPRKPIADQARKEAVDGRKWADRLHSLMRDDRRGRNAEELCVALQGDLMHVRDVVNEALETLSPHDPDRSS